MSSVYRHINVAGETIYVGCSNCPACRFNIHKSASSWAREVVRIDVEWFATREEALNAERDLIASMKPKYNKQWNPRVKRIWPANEGHVYLSNWMRRTRTSVDTFAQRLGVPVSEAKRLAGGVVHVQTQRARNIAIATDGYVPMRAWDRPGAYGPPSTPLLRFPTADEAAEEFAHSLDILAAQRAYADRQAAKGAAQ